MRSYRGGSSGSYPRTTRLCLIDVFAVGYAYDRHECPCVIQQVHDPVISRADPPLVSLYPLSFLQPAGPGSSASDKILLSIRLKSISSSASGAFDFHLDLPAPFPPGSPGIDDANAPDLPGSVMDAVQKLGLKFEPVNGTDEFVVIDHIERPTEN
jgi:hypothetical protein